MKILLLLAVLMIMMLPRTCYAAAQLLPNGEYKNKLRSLDSETDMHKREGFLDAEAHKLLIQAHVTDNKKKVSTISDYIACGRNALTHCCSIRVACVAAISVIVIYSTFARLTYGLDYCSKAFPGTDSRCMDFNCLKECDLLENYSRCKRDRTCWRENHDQFEDCLNDQCVYATDYCDNTMAFCLVCVVMPLSVCMRMCMR